MAQPTNREPLTDETWRAIVGNDASRDGEFFYAVTSTGIFCRPSCKSKPPKKEHIVIFRSAEQAMAAQFRPCKRCRPTGRRLPNHEWADRIAAYIDGHYMRTLTLGVLAGVCHGSPYHLHRTFKKVRGMTPVEYIRQKRVEQAGKLLLTTGKTVAEIGLSVGLANTAYFITLFKKKTGYTPASYRRERPVISTDPQGGGQAWKA